MSKKPTAQHEVICHMAATGANASTIAKKLGKTAATIKKVLDGNEEYIAQLRVDLFSWEPKKLFQANFPTAFNVANQIMNDPNAKESVRLHAAQDFMDRAAGKATQHVEVQATLIKDLYEKMDKSDAIEADFSEIKEIEGMDQVDSFLGEDNG